MNNILLIGYLGWIRLAELLLENLSYQSVVECVNKALSFVEKRKLESGGKFNTYVKLNLGLTILAFI